MKLIIKKSVYTEKDDTKPVGHAKVDSSGNVVTCTSCNKGIRFIEIGTGKEKCTMCNYPN
jgi:hypothetical protein